jgi:hypothetical protein
MNILDVKACNLLHTGRAILDAFWVTDNTQCGSLEICYVSVFVCLAASSVTVSRSLSQFVLFLSGMKAHETTKSIHIPSSRRHKMYHNHLFHLRITTLGSRMLSSELFPGGCSTNANVSEHPVCSTFIGE